MTSQKHSSPGEPDRATGVRPLAPRPAIFLDRDGTLIEEIEYLSEPGEIALIPGAAPALRRLREAGFALVVVTNQSAVGRGWLAQTRLIEIHVELERQLALENVELDAIYSCPDFDAQSGTDLGIADPRADRKPGGGMLIRAAEELNLEIGASWMIGDHSRDLAAGRNAGCLGALLVLTGHGRLFQDEVESETAASVSVCSDLPEAAQRVLESIPGGKPAPARGSAPK